MFALGACSWEASTTWSILHDSQHIPMGQQLVISFEAHAQHTRMHIREGRWQGSHCCRELWLQLLAPRCTDEVPRSP